MRPELLLHPNIPKPLHGMSPRVLMGDEWWDYVRHWVYNKAEYKCQCCGIGKADAKYHKWLEAHETYEYDYKDGLATVNEIVALCHSCHNYIHSGRLEILMQNGTIPYEKYDDIIHHGDAILSAYNLRKPEPPAQIADWGRWRIVIAGVTYPTRFKNYQEWAREYDR